MSDYYVYLTRVIPALSVVGLVVLLFFSFVISPYGKLVDGEYHGEATTSQLVLGVYTVLLHLLSVMFPARVCWAIGDVVRRMKESASIIEKPKKRKTRSVKSEQGNDASSSPLFVIIIPAYKEDMETLEETLRVLACHAQARHNYHVYLAMEEKEVNSDVKAANLTNNFQKSFYRMSYTIHPCDLPGEAQGKSSNESFAARQAFKDYPDEIKKDIIMTVMDADTHLSARYFAQVTRYHVDYPDTNSETVYVPPLVFDRNIQQVPLPVRTADLVWAGAGMSSLYPGSSICIPTSVYSLPMTLVESVGGWDTGPGAIGEDMHMYLKCFFALSGNLTVRVVHAAASQCNVSSDLKGWWGYVDGLNARYKQALRHMWGAMDTGYAVRQTLGMIKRHYDASEAITTGPANISELASYTKDLVLSGMSTVCNSNWAVFQKNARMSRLRSSTSIGSESALKPIHLQNVCILFHRMFEAHFLPIHLAMILATSTIYDLIAGSSVPRELAWALYISGYLRFLGWSLICVYFYRYATYHRLCVDLREKEMDKAGLLEEVSEHDGFSRQIFGTFGFVEAGLFPLGGFIFGAIPACQAVLSHVFTDRLTYQVSLKPQFIRRWQSAKSESLRPKSSKGKQAQPKSKHARCPSDTWRKQAISRFDHVTSALAFNRPVKRED